MRLPFPWNQESVPGGRHRCPQGLGGRRPRGRRVSQRPLLGACCGPPAVPPNRCPLVVGRTWGPPPGGVTDSIGPRIMHSCLCHAWGSNHGTLVHVSCALTTEPRHLVRSGGGVEVGRGRGLAQTAVSLLHALPRPALLHLPQYDDGSGPDQAKAQQEPMLDAAPQPHSPEVSDAPWEQCIAAKGVSFPEGTCVLASARTRTGIRACAGTPLPFGLTLYPPQPAPSAPNGPPTVV